MAYVIDIQDLEYVRHGDQPLLARLYRPQGSGPFPLLVHLHGGAWTMRSRLDDTAIAEPLARSGVVVAALDFRMPPDAPYPASMADINYGIRWAKTQAEAWGSNADLVGVMGSSSGGHQAVLTGMRPGDPRYTALPQPAGSASVDAKVRCVIACWPVIDPLGRYQYAKERQAGGQPYPELIDRVIPSHDLYWLTEAAMAEASPVRILERRETVELPPVLYLQGTQDDAHPRAHLDRFVELYCAAGGEVDLHLWEGETSSLFGQSDRAQEAAGTIAQMVEFVRTQMQAVRA
jgi:acetyl esterase